MTIDELAKGIVPDIVPYIKEYGEHIVRLILEDMQEMKHIKDVDKFFHATIKTYQFAIDKSY